MTRPDSPVSSAARFGTWLAARGWVHLLLLTGVTLFLYPLLWMTCTSLKTDEEMADAHLLPSFPTFRATSPYVRPSAPLIRPEAVSERAWPGLSAALLARAEAALAGRIAVAPSAPVDQTAWIKAAAVLATGQALQRIPATSLAHDHQALADFSAQLSDAILDQSLDSSLARCELQGLELYTDDAQLYPLYSGTALQGVLRVEAGHAALAPSASGMRVDYAFASGDDAPVVLAIPFQLPVGVDAEHLHKLVLSLRNDDSWHRITATLDCGGRHWVSQRVTPLAQCRQTTITFQPPGFDDATFKARLWVPLSDGGPSAAAPGACCLRVEIRPSSTLQAIWQKCRHNYDLAFHAVPFWTYLGNSVILVALTVLGSLFSSAFVAYAFARLRWPGRAIALTVMLATMMLPSQVTMIPSFLIWRELGWYNTLNPLWIGAWTGNAFFIFLMVQHLKTIPRELEEAARIDGLNTVQTWWYIIVPQLKPTLAAIAIMSFMNAWNDFMGPLIYLRDQSRFPLSLGLFGMKVEDTGANFGLMMAGDLLLTLPAILVFFCFQRYFIQGMTVSGMKG